MPHLLSKENCCGAETSLALQENKRTSTKRTAQGWNHPVRLCEQSSLIQWAARAIHVCLVGRRKVLRSVERHNQPKYPSPPHVASLLRRQLAMALGMPPKNFFFQASNYRLAQIYSRKQPRDHRTSPVDSYVASIYLCRSVYLKQIAGAILVLFWGCRRQYRLSCTITELKWSPFVEGW